MIFDELNVKNFGKLNQVRIPLKTGINVIYGENESGKTTLHTFLRGMLFGMVKKRGRAAKGDAFTGYEPWENPGIYGGSLRFTCDHKHFCLERSFARGYQRVSLICEDDGERLSPEQGDLDMLMGNISEAVFDNTVSVGQLKSVTRQELVEELKNYMANCQGGGDGELDVRGALDRLKERKKQLLQEEHAHKDRLEAQKHELTLKLTYLEQELKESERQLKQVRSQKEKAGQTCGEQKGGLRFFLLLVSAAVLFVVLGCLFWLPWQGKAAAAVLGTIIEGILIYGGVRQRQNRLRESEEMEKKLDWELERLRDECALRRTAAGNLKSDFRELDEQESVPVFLKTQQKAVDMAIEKITSLSIKMQNRMGRALKIRTSEILKEITFGVYDQVDMDDFMQIQVNTGGRYVPLERLSRGTIEQVYFAFRMAVSEVLCSQEPMPVILDDVFAMYDEQRLGQALRWLAAHKRQTLLFTCHTRESEILGKLGIPCHCVRLT